MITYLRYPEEVKEWAEAQPAGAAVVLIGRWDEITRAARLAGLPKPERAAVALPGGGKCFLVAVDHLRRHLAGLHPEGAVLYRSHLWRPDLEEEARAYLSASLRPRREKGGDGR